jgi:RND family efflux transporter MFP subunit
MNTFFDEGQLIHAGDLLFEIDPRQYKTRVDQAQAQLDQDEAAYTQAKNDLARVQKLAASHGAPTSEVDRQIATFGRYAGAIKNDQAAIEGAKLQLGYCHITAPITGRIGLRIVDKGNVVHAANTTKLAEIVQVQPIAVIFPVPQGDLFDLQQKFNSGNELIVEALIGSGTGAWVRGRLAGIDNETDAQTGNIRAKAIFKNSDNRLFPGSSVPVRVPIETRHSVLLVPNAANRVDGDGWSVFVVKSDHTVERRTVTLRRGETESEVKSGLSEGDMVVIEAAEKLVDGSKVELPNTGSATTNLDRQVAGWVLDNRGTIGLKEFPGRSFQYVESLPPTDFHIETVSLKDYVTENSHEDAAAPGNSGRTLVEARGRRFREKTRPARRRDEESSKIFHRIQFDDAEIDRLASLTDLRELAFASAALTDGVLARLTKLTNLTRLSLDKSSITDSGLVSLVEMRRLTDLDLDSTAITNAGLKDLARLKSLSDLTVVPEAQRSGRELRRLPTLTLNHTRTTEAGIDQLHESLPNCIIFASHLPGYYPAPPGPNRSDRDWAAWLLGLQLNPGNWQIFTDLDQETGIGKYEDLPPVDFRIVRVDFDSAQGQTSPMQQVQTARSPVTSIRISPQLLRQMSTLTKLRSLAFGRLSAHSFEGLADLKQLESLSIDDTDAADEALRPLGGLTHLRSLELRDKYITDAGLKYLVPLNELAALGLNGSPKGLRGTGLSQLSCLPNLKKLELMGSGIEDGTMAAIGKLAQLEQLNLSGTTITGKGLASLASLKRLRSLQLNDCGRLEGTTLEALVGLPRLEILSLEQCPIDDTAVEALKKLTAMHQLDLAYTNLSPQGVAALRIALPKCRFGDARNGVHRRRFGAEPRQEGGTESEPTQPAKPNSKVVNNSRTGVGTESNPAARKNQVANVTSNRTEAQAAAGASQTTKPRNTSESSLPGNWPSEEQVLARMNAESSDDRAIAQWVHAYHGRMVTIQKDQEPTIPNAVALIVRTLRGQHFAANAIGKWTQRGEPIAAGDFRILGIFFDEQPEKSQRQFLRGLDVPENRAGVRVPFPEAVVSRLARLSDLRVLKFNDGTCDEATLKSIRGLKQIEVLELPGTKITDAGLRWLSNLNSLRALDLRDTPITDKGLQELARDKLLAGASERTLSKPWMRQEPPTLWLDGTRVTEEGIAAFQKEVPQCEISAGEVLGVSNDPQRRGDDFVRIPPGPGRADRDWAEWLFSHLDCCTIRTDADPETVVKSLDRLPPIDFRITDISFYKYPVRDLPKSLSLNAPIIRRLKDLPALESLSFSPAYDDWIPAITTLTRLKSLSIESANTYHIGDDALKPIGGMINLTSLRIESECITDQLPKNLAKLSGLKTLELLNGRYLHGGGLRDLTDLTNLKFLNLADSAIDDAGLAFIAALPSLEFLELKGTWISGKGLLPLGRLPRLAVLDFSGCRRIDETAFASLKNVKSLRQLWVANSRTHQELIGEYSGVLPTCAILWKTDIATEFERERRMRAGMSPIGVRPEGMPSAPKK